MTALLVLVIGIYSAAELFTQAQRNANLAETRIIGHSLGELKLEELRASGDQLRTGLGSSQTYSLPPSGVGVFEQNPGYSWQARITQSKIVPLTLSIDVAVFRAGRQHPVARAEGIKIFGSKKSAGSGA